MFCRIANGALPAAFVHEDAEVVAFRDLHPAAPVHFLVVPRRHVSSLIEVGPEDAALLGRLLSVAADLGRRFETEDAPGGFRVVINTGADAGQSVFHLHVHVLAGRRFDWPPG